MVINMVKIERLPRKRFNALEGGTAWTGVVALGGMFYLTQYPANSSVRMSSSPTPSSVSALPIAETMAGGPAE